jgi:hypothetical protein
MMLRVMAVLLCGGGVPVGDHHDRTARLQIAFNSAAPRCCRRASGRQAAPATVTAVAPSNRSQEPAAMTVAQITPPAPRTEALAGHAYGLPVVRELQQPVADASADRTW